MYIPNCSINYCGLQLMCKQPLKLYSFDSLQYYSIYCLDGKCIFFCIYCYACVNLVAVTNGCTAQYWVAPHQRTSRHNLTRLLIKIQVGAKQRVRADHNFEARKCAPPFTLAHQCATDYASSKSSQSQSIISATQLQFRA